MPSEKIKLVLIVSEQIFPLLSSVLHYWKEGELSTVHLLYTDNESRSRAPARRLSALIADIQSSRPFKDWGAINVVLANNSVGIQPQDVRERIKTLIESDQSVRWILNATGGLKLMAFGHPDLLARHSENPRFDIIYQEIGQGWFRLDRNKDGLVDAQKIFDQPDMALLDLVPVEALVRTQFMVGEDIQVESRPLPSNFGSIRAFVEQCGESNWNWGTTLNTRRVSGEGTWFDYLKNEKTSSGTGPLFEHLIGAAIREMGIENAVYSLEYSKARSGTNKSPRQQEMDIVLCKKGKVFLLDLKLTNDKKGPSDAESFYKTSGSGPKRGDQIRSATDTARAIGGINAHAILIRPHWDFDEGTETLAKAFQATLLYQKDMPSLFATLARIVDGILTDDLSAADRVLDTYSNSYGTAITLDPKEKNARDILATQGVADNIGIDMSRVFELFCEKRGQNWCVVETESFVLLMVKQKEGVPSAVKFNPPKGLHGAFGSGKHYSSISKVNAGTFWWFAPSKMKEIMSYLNTLAGECIDIGTFISFCNKLNPEITKEEHFGSRSLTEPQKTTSKKADAPHLAPSTADSTLAGRQTGTVKWFNPTKGYGFIKPAGGGNDVFVHITNVQNAGLSTLSEGQKVSYTLATERGKTYSIDLRVEDDDSTARGDDANSATALEAALEKALKNQNRD